MKIIKFLPSLLLLFLVVSISAQDSFKAKVTGVVDGDTITVLTKENTQKTIRLIGIDAPEKDQEFGDKAKQFLSDFVFGKSVNVTGLKKDCLGHIVASISFNNKDLSLLMVESGFAWFDASCQTGQNGNEGLIKAETIARQKPVGLWQNPHPVQPSEYIRLKQAEAEAYSKPTSPKSDRIILEVPADVNMPAGVLTNLVVGAGYHKPSMSYDEAAYGCPNPERPVYVRSYVRDDGTYVRAYCRSLPSR